MSHKIEELTLADLMQKIEAILNQNPKPIENIRGIYELNILDEDEGTYQLHIENGKARVVKGEEHPSDCTLQMSLKSFGKFLVGSMNGAVAFMTGKLKVKGSMGKALQLESILEQYNIEDYL